MPDTLSVHFVPHVVFFAISRIGLLIGLCPSSSALLQILVAGAFISLRIVCYVDLIHLNAGVHLAYLGHKKNLVWEKCKYCFK